MNFEQRAERDPKKQLVMLLVNGGSAMGVGAGLEVGARRVRSWGGGGGCDGSR